MPLLNRSSGLLSTVLEVVERKSAINEMKQAGMSRSEYFCKKFLVKGRESDFRMKKDQE